MRVALFGYGSMGKHHARHLAASEGPGNGVDLVVIDPALGLTGDTAAIDAAVICTPTLHHAEVALPLLARGVPCLVEKPLAATLEEARALAAFPHLMVGHIERFNPAISVLRGVEVRFVQAERLSKWAARARDVDVILDLMIHDLDLFCHLVPGEIVDVRANGLAVTTGSLDLAQARVETADGRVGTFTASRVSRQASRRFRAFAADSYWSLDLGERQVTQVRWGDGQLSDEPVPVPVADPLAAELAAFLSAVRGETPFAVPGSEGVRALELAGRVRSAIRSP